MAGRRGTWKGAAPRRWSTGLAPAWLSRPSGRRRRVVRHAALAEGVAQGRAGYRRRGSLLWLLAGVVWAACGLVWIGLHYARWDDEPARVAGPSTRARRRRHVEPAATAS